MRRLMAKAILLLLPGVSLWTALAEPARPAPIVSKKIQQGTASPQSRTFVSGRGNDTNPCTAALPCRTLNAALQLTIAGGEIYVLDTADFGPVNINKAVTIAS